MGQSGSVRFHDRILRRLTRGIRIDLVRVRVVVVRTMSGYEVGIHGRRNRWALIVGVGGGYGFRIRFVVPSHVLRLGNRTGTGLSRSRSPGR
jgi:hypothetical protein